MRTRLLALVALTIARHSYAFLVSSTTTSFHGKETRRHATEDSNELLKKAAALRDEASQLEETLKSTRPSTTSNSTLPVTTLCKSMNDSMWTLTYRFADRPENSRSNEDAARNLYSGKLTVLFLNNGYTQIIRHESTATVVEKVWGWDVERSSNDDDDSEYLLFSVDFVLPATGKQRFYFQARNNIDGIGSISLTEGTITVKQDVVDAKTSRWSLLSPRGILAEFRAVGEFIGKPSTAL